MYMSFRLMHADMAKMVDAVALATYARDHLNEHYGTNFAVTVNVGGDPTAISLAGPWESMADYEAMRAKVQADPQLQSLTRTAGSMITGVQDSIAQVIKAPSDRMNYAQVNQARMRMAAVTDAIPFAIEVAEFAGKKIGRDVGVMAAMTGNRSQLAWIGYGDSLDQLAQEGQAMETDPDYLAFFARSEDLFVPDTLEQSIWQFV